MGDFQIMGKEGHKDEENLKSTYVRLNGLERAKKRLKELTDLSVEAIEDYYDNAKFFRDLTLSLQERDR